MIPRNIDRNSTVHYSYYRSQVIHCNFIGIELEITIKIRSHLAEIRCKFTIVLQEITS